MLLVVNNNIFVLDPTVCHVPQPPTPGSEKARSDALIIGTQ